MIERTSEANRKDRVVERLAVPRAFALMLESACEDFEFLRALVNREMANTGSDH